jgi:MFS family permease
LRSEGSTHTVSTLPGLIALNAYWIPLAVQEAALLAIAVPSALIRFDPVGYRSTLAILSSLNALVNTLFPPLAGAWSDWLRRNGHRRRGVVLFGAALNVIGLLLMPRAHSAPQFGAFMMLASLGQTISSTAYQAMLPEAVARRAWGIASGVRGAATLLGTVGGLALAAVEVPNVVFTLAAVFTALFSITLVMFVEGPSSNGEEHARIRDWHDFIVVFISRAIITFGLVLLMTYILYFFRDALHVSSAAVGTGFVGLGALIGAAITSIWLGKVSDRYPRKIVVALAGIPMGVAALGFAIVPSVGDIFGFAVLFGLGYGGIISTGWALALDAMPELGDVARDLGIWGLATHIPAVIAPLVAGAILQHFNGTLNGYRVLFACAAFTFVIGSFSVLAVRGKNHAGQQ